MRSYNVLVFDRLMAVFASTRGYCSAMQMYKDDEIEDPIASHTRRCAP
jgi:hypothetical protein